MATTPTRRVDPPTRAADQQALTALQNMAGYQPANPAYTVSALSAKLAAAEAAQTAEVNARNALAAARDALAAAEWEFHYAILGAKEQVIAQYGRDSDQVQALGLKKKSERKRPARPAKTAG